MAKAKKKEMSEDQSACQQACINWLWDTKISIDQQPLAADAFYAGWIASGKPDQGKPRTMESKFRTTRKK
jgi:hypothetical protein